MFIASVRPSVRLSVCPSVRLKPKFGRLKTKFDDDAGSAKRTIVRGSAKRPRKTKFGPTFYVSYLLRLSVRPFGRLKTKFDDDAGSAKRTIVRGVREAAPKNKVQPHVLILY